MQRFDGAVAVVTGGGQGIGAAIAHALAAEGAAVVVAARRSDRIEHVATGTNAFRYRPMSARRWWPTSAGFVPPRPRVGRCSWERGPRIGR